jgi:hypothetical protein
MKKTVVQINRAPVLTLWAVIVAERLGYDHAFALTLGKAVAVLNAQSKGQRLGIFEKPKQKPLKVRRKAQKPKEKSIVMFMGRAITTVESTLGRRVVVKNEVIDPKSVEKYLSQKFGGDLNDVQDAMRVAAKAYKPDKLAVVAFALYEKFRPSIPEGQKGWGAKGELNLNLIRSLVK